MADKTREPAPVLAGHGAAELPAVRVDSYNVELRDAEGFIGDRASKRAFAALLDDWRERVGRVAPDPFGDTPSEDLKKKARARVARPRSASRRPSSPHPPQRSTSSAPGPPCSPAARPPTHTAK